MKRTPLRRHRKSDPVTPELRAAVLERDGGCVARLFDEELMYCRGRLTLDHVKDEPRMGVRAPSDTWHLVTICSWHHLETGWATSHRHELRAYLRYVNERAERLSALPPEPQEATR